MCGRRLSVETTDVWDAARICLSYFSISHLEIEGFLLSPTVDSAAAVPAATSSRALQLLKVSCVVFCSLGAIDLPTMCTKFLSQFSSHLFTDSYFPSETDINSGCISSKQYIEQPKRLKKLNVCCNLCSKSVKLLSQF